MLLTTLAPHLPGKHWLIRVWEFPRLQQLVIMVVQIAGWIWSWPHHTTALGFCIALSLACLYQLMWVLPYTPLWRSQVKQVVSSQDQDTLSILTSNVYTPNDNIAALIKLIEDLNPDMVITLESDSKWQKGLEPLHSAYPHRMACPLDNLYGMHLYSKVPFDSNQLLYRVEQDVPSFQVFIRINQQPVRVEFLHPKPPSPTENETATPRDKELTQVGRELADQALPYIVTGDLNDVAWSPTTREFRKLANAKDPRIGRGFFNTFHAHYPIARWPLDHVFHSEHFDLVDIKRLGDIGSDHFPLYVKLVLRPASTDAAN